MGKVLEPKGKTMAVVDAFQLVSSCEAYRNAWIADYEWLNVIRHELSLPSDLDFSVTHLNSSLSRNKTFKVIFDGGNGPYYRREYSQNC